MISVHAAFNSPLVFISMDQRLMDLCPCTSRFHLTSWIPDVFFLQSLYLGPCNTVMSVGVVILEIYGLISFLLRCTSSMPSMQCYPLIEELVQYNKRPWNVRKYIYMPKKNDTQLWGMSHTINHTHHPRSTSSCHRLVVFRLL